MDVLRSVVAEHALEKGHPIGFDRAVVLEKEPEWRKRLVKEALWTNKLGSANRVKHSLGVRWSF